MENKSMKRTLLDCAAYLFAFFAIQAVVLIAVDLTYKGNLSSPTPITIFSLTSSGLAIALFAWRRWTPCNGDYIKTRPWDVAFWAVVLAVGAMTPIGFIDDMLGVELSDDLMEIFGGLMSSDLGLLSIAFVTPVAEEMVFRGAILRRLDEALGHRLRWVSIATTALLFAAAHGNMAQGVSAFIMGLALGWVYIRTRSILPGIIIHWANNTIAVLLAIFLPGTADMTLVEYFDGDIMRVAAMLVCSLMVAGAAIFQLNLRMHHSRRVSPRRAPQENLSAHKDA